MFKAAVLTVSDRSSQGLRPDAAGPLVAELLTDAGYEVAFTQIVPDEKPRIEAALRQWCDRGPGGSDRHHWRYRLLPPGCDAGSHHRVCQRLRRAFPRPCAMPLCR